MIRNGRVKAVLEAVAGCQPCSAWEVDARLPERFRPLEVYKSAASFRSFQRVNRQVLRDLVAKGVLVRLRHALFGFQDVYHVSTWKSGEEYAKWWKGSGCFRFGLSPREWPGACKEGGARRRVG